MLNGWALNAWRIMTFVFDIFVLNEQCTNSNGVQCTPRLICMFNLKIIIPQRFNVIKRAQSATKFNFISNFFYSAFADLLCNRLQKNDSLSSKVLTFAQFFKRIFSPLTEYRQTVFMKRIKFSFINERLHIAYYLSI